MERPGKRLTNSLALRTKRVDKKQNAKFAINDITNQDLRDLLKFFNKLPYLGYKHKHVYNEPTEAYFYPTKHITKLIKSKRHIWLRTKGVKSGVNKKNWTHQRKISI